MNASQPSDQVLAVIPSPVGKLRVSGTDNQITAITFVADTVPSQQPNTAMGQQAVESLNHYFSNPKATFQLPLQRKVSEFQQRVMDALTKIPVGQTKTYGELAKQLHTSARAIGNACRLNPLPIIIPCHRVVGQNGLGGFMGAVKGHELDNKAWLLSHENAQY